MGELKKAERLLREAITKLSAAYGDRNVGVGAARATLGQCFGRMGRYEEAEHELGEAYQIIQAAVDLRTYHGQHVVKLHVQFYEAWNKPEEAAKWKAKLE